ncbi:MAG: hypothetical protein ACR2M2_06135 [Gaiellaceae bacterium]
MARVSQERAGRGSAHEQRSTEEERTADDRGARLADHPRQGASQREADPAPVVSTEKRHQSQEADSQAEPKRAHVEKLAAREHQASDGEQREREHVCGVAHDLPERVGEPRANRATVETEVEDHGEHQSERCQCEPEELVLAVRARPLRPFLDACGDAWPKRPPLPAARHGAWFAAARRAPPRLLIARYPSEEIRSTSRSKKAVVSRSTPT